MVFTDIERMAYRRLCTLAILVGNLPKHVDGLLYTGQQLGIPKDDVLDILSEYDDRDTIKFKSEKEKIQFVKDCFFFIAQKNQTTPEAILYQEVLRALDLFKPSLN